MFGITEHNGFDSPCDHLFIPDPLMIKMENTDRSSSEAAAASTAGQRDLSKNVHAMSYPLSSQSAARWYVSWVCLAPQTRVFRDCPCSGLAAEATHWLRNARHARQTTCAIDYARRTLCVRAGPTRCSQHYDRLRSLPECQMIAS
jgi:hypothetical protein